MIPSTGELLSKHTNHKVRKFLGRAYLRADRVEDALEVFSGVLAEYPNDIDVLAILGNLYHLAGNQRAAALVFQKVLAIDPQSPLANPEAGRVISHDDADWQVDDPLAGDALALLGTRLSGAASTDLAGAVRRAADILYRVTEDTPPADKQGERLMPALIEMNIRQARASGMPDVAETLRSLQISLNHQVDDSWADDLLNDTNPAGGGAGGF